MYIKLLIYDDKFRQTFPGWDTLVRKVMEKSLTLKDVTKCVGVTRRQIDYWIQKGVLPSKSKYPQEWKRFSLIDLFVLAVGLKFRSKGIEIASLPYIVAGLPPHYSDPQNEIFVPIVYGHEVFLYSDFEDLTGVFSPDVEDKKQDGGPTALLKIELMLEHKTSFFAGVSLKKICDELARKLDLPDFRVNVLPDGQYKFIINDVPLELESLREEDQVKWLDGEKIWSEAQEELLNEQNNTRR